MLCALAAVMGMYDYYRTKTPCPSCAGELDISQGKFGPNASLTWIEGEKIPIPHSDQKGMDLSNFSLPDYFDLGSPQCKDCGRYFFELKGVAQNGIWVGTDYFGSSIPASKEIGGYRMCSSCFEAWKFPENAIFANCPNCETLTKLRV